MIVNNFSMTISFAITKMIFRENANLTSLDVYSGRITG